MYAGELSVDYDVYPQFLDQKQGFPGSPLFSRLTPQHQSARSLTALSVMGSLSDNIFGINLKTTTVTTVLVPMTMGATLSFCKRLHVG